MLTPVPVPTRRRFERHPSEIRRARVLAAVTEAVAQLGYCQLTVDRIVARAGISRRSFYHLFADPEQCLMEAFDDALERMRLALSGSVEGHAPWSDRIRNALAELLFALDDAPQLARFCIVETARAGPPLQERRALALEQLAQLLMRTQREADPSDRDEECQAVIARTTVAGALSLVHQHLQRQSRAPLAALLNPMMAAIVAPYLGLEAAAAELCRPAPAHRAISLSRLAEPARIDIPVTYRAGQVIRFIAQQPGASNRAIAKACGGLDQGQISRMLTRLSNQGLLQNLTAPRSLGRANAWRLTGRGERLMALMGERRGSDGAVEAGSCGATPAPPALEWTLPSYPRPATIRSSASSVPRMGASAT